MKNTLHYGRIEEMLGKPFDPIRAFIDRVPYLVEAARSGGIKDAFSYRDFHVAGAIYAMNQSEKTILQAVAGNLKQRQETDKVCAEKKLHRRAVKLGMTSTIGFVVLGTTDRTQIKEVTGIGTPTLHMCNVCRDEVPASPIVSRSSLVVTGGLEADIHQVFTVGQVIDSYGRIARGEPAPELFKYHSDFTDWEQRVATYAFAVDRLAEANPSIEMRQGIAQLALNKELTI